MWLDSKGAARRNLGGVGTVLYLACGAVYATLYVSQNACSYPPKVSDAGHEI